MAVDAHVEVSPSRLEDLSEKDESEASQHVHDSDADKLEDQSTHRSSGIDVEHHGTARQIHGVRWFLVVVATLASTFIYALDNTIVADIVPAIVNEFNSAAQLSWLSVGFVLGGSALVLPFGKLFGLFDSKILFIASLILFLGASALCGGAPNMAAEIVGRALAGAGGNGMYLGVTTTFSLSTSDAERPVYLALIGLVWGLGTVLGPIIGGSLAKATWRWAFYLNLVVGGVFAPIYLLLLPSHKPRPGESVGQLLRGFDYLGSALSIAFLVCFMIATNFGGISYPWNSGSIIALYVVCGVTFVAFLVQQRWSFFTSDRIFPMHFLRNRDAVLLFICCAACNVVAFVPVYYVPVYFQFTRGDDPIEAAVRLLPFIMFLVAAIMLNGHTLGRIGYFQPWYVGGSALSLIGGVLMSRITPTTPVSNIYGFEVLLGIGAGSFIQAGYAIIQTVVPTSDLAYSISFMMFAQLAGISFGLSISGAVFLNQSVQNLGYLLPSTPRDILIQAVSGTSGTFFATLSPSVQTAALSALVDGLKQTFVLVYASAALSLVLGCFFKTRVSRVTGVAVA